VLGYEVAERISEDEYHEIVTKVNEAIEDHGSVRILVRMPEATGVELGTFGDRLKFLKEHVGDIERYAVVTDDTRAEWLARIGDKVTPIEFRTFAVEEEPDAWRWVSSRAAV
jgi:hypothetical protein